jgi:hypothetical protein
MKRPRRYWKATDANKIELGDVVEHWKFGFGNVLSHGKTEDGRPTVTVFFECDGNRVLVLEYARLRRLAILERMWRSFRRLLSIVLHQWPDRLA